MDELKAKIAAYYQAVETGTLPDGTVLPTANDFHNLLYREYGLNETEDMLWDQWVEERQNRLLWMMRVGMGEDPVARLERNKYRVDIGDEGITISFGEYDR